MKNKSSAVHVAHAFSSQIIFLAAKLCETNEISSTYSLEYKGDVAFDSEYYSIIFELKNTIAKKNLLSNNSVDLWKTLYNWANIFWENKEENLEKYEFVLYVNSRLEHTDFNKDIANLINECNSKYQVKTIVNKISSEITQIGAREENLAIIKGSKPKTGKYYIRMLLSIELCDIFEKMLPKISITIDNTKYMEQLEKTLSYHYSSYSEETFKDLVFCYIGWVKHTIESKRQMKYVL